MKTAAIGYPKTFSSLQKAQRLIADEAVTVPEEGETSSYDRRWHFINSCSQKSSIDDNVS